LPPEIAAAETRQAMLYSSFAVLLEATWQRESFDELGDGIAALWNRPATRRLLIELTSTGWPRVYATFDPGHATVATGPTGRRGPVGTPIFQATSKDLSTSPLD
jgi:hypothetical protein